MDKKILIVLKFFIFSIVLVLGFYSEKSSAETWSYLPIPKKACGMINTKQLTCIIPGQALKPICSTLNPEHPEKKEHKKRPDDDQEKNEEIWVRFSAPITACRPTEKKNGIEMIICAIPTMPLKLGVCPTLNTEHPEKKEHKNKEPEEPDIPYTPDDPAIRV